MATTAVIAATANAADSTEFTLKAPGSVYLTSSTGVITERAKVQILKKVGTATYEPYTEQQGSRRRRVALFIQQQQPVALIADPGTYIARKSPTTQSIGVSVDDNV